MLKKILKWWILTIIFLLPLFWLPFSFEFLEFNKLYFLFFFSWGGIFLWNLKMIFVDKGIRIRWSRFDWLVFGFFLVVIFSFVFSQDRVLSLFGTYGRFNNGLMAYLSFFALYFLIRNNLKIKEKEEEKIIEEKKTEEGITIKVKKGVLQQRGVVSLDAIFWALFFSSFILVLWLWGWLLLGLRYQRFFSLLVFSPVASMAYGTSVYLSLITVLVLAKIFTLGEVPKRKIKKVFLGVFLILSTTLLIIFDFFWAWTILGFSLLWFVAFSLKKKLFQEDVQKLLVPIFLILLSALFLLIDFGSLIRGLGMERMLLFNYPRETVLWQSESWRIGINVAKSGLKNGILGTGPGTFVLDFSKFKSDKILQSNLWATRFFYGGNNVSEMLATLGILGGGIFVLILGILFFFLLKTKKEPKKIIPWGGFFVAILVMQFVFWQNMVLGGMSWLALAIGAGVIFGKEKKYPFKERPEIGLIFETITLILLLVLAGGLFFGIKFYLAEYHYAQAQREIDLDKKVLLIQKAIRLNPWQNEYKIIFAKNLLSGIRNELLKPQGEQDSQKISNWAEILGVYLLEINQAKGNNVLIYQSLGDLYRDLIGIAKGEPEERAIENYSKAIELEPKNPVLYTERGKIYWNKNQKDKAKADFQKAINLAPLYLDAQIQMTFVEEEEGKIKEAIERLENLAGLPLFGTNVSLLFRLGWLYYNNKEYNKATLVLERARVLDPFHSNVLFVLGLAYEKIGQKDKAKEALERVVQLNPDNITAKEKLQELKGEKTEEVLLLPEEKETLPEETEEEK